MSNLILAIKKQPGQSKMDQAGESMKGASGDLENQDPKEAQKSRSKLKSRWKRLWKKLRTG